MERISRPSPEEIKFLVNYEFLDQGAEIIFYAYAEPCEVNCDPKCNEQYFEEKKQVIRYCLLFWLLINNATSSSNLISTRSRRSITAMQIELTQDLYPLHGSKVILLGSPSTKLPVLQVAGVEQAKVTFISIQYKMLQMEPISLKESLIRCILHDSTCFFSFALASIQFCLVVLCFLVMYCYIRVCFFNENSHKKIF